MDDFPRSGAEESEARALMLPNAQPKPERAVRKAKQRKAERSRRLTRAQVREIVFIRERGRCQRCRVPVSFDVAAWKDEHAQVNEPLPRSLGGDPLDPKQCELVCRKCHYGGPSGAHAPTKARMTQERRQA